MKINYDYKKFEFDVEAIIKFVKYKKWSVKIIYAIPKGGLVLGVFLANRLGVPLCLSFSDCVATSFHYENILVVDDIADSGKTFTRVPDVCSLKTVALYVKDGTQFVPNFYCRRCKKDEWVSFFWEPPDKKPERDGTKIL